MHTLQALSISALCLFSTAVAVEQAELAEPLDAQQAIDACRVLENPQDRLACYDRIQGASITGGRYQREIPLITTDPTAAAVAAESLEPEAQPEIPIERSRMMREWELDNATHGGLLRVRTHNAVYALPARYSSNPNDRPSTPAEGRTFDESLNLDNIEAKFQLSLKTKLLDNLTGNNGDLWFGFTQQSSWQAYNTIESSPFRETSYAPEIFGSWRTGVDLPFGWRWQMVNLGFIHQSNGRSLPASRSWNRIYAQFGFERGDWELFIRPWTAFDTEDQPDIQNFYGRGDIRLMWHRSKHDFGLMARLAADDNRGAIQFDWHYPLFGDLKAYLQVFHGYGETLIDYNHRQTTFGIGVSLVQ